MITCLTAPLLLHGQASTRCKEPLSENQVIDLHLSKMSNDRLGEIVQHCGLAFVWSAEIARRLADAGIPETLASSLREVAPPETRLDPRALFARGKEAQGTPGGTANAVHWYRLAAQGGLAEAQLELAKMYAAGRGTPRDDEESTYWFRRAAELGSPDAAAALAGRLVAGLGSPKNIKEAVDWYRKAAASGEGDSEVALSDLLFADPGLARELGEAQEWLERAVAKEHPEGMYRMGLAALKASPPQYEKARAWLERASGRGSPGAIVWLGRMLAEGWGGPVDLDHAIQLFRATADKGIDEAQYRLGLAYAQGRGVPQFPAEAFKWYRKAAEQGNIDALLSVGQASELGAGTDVDFGEAFRWYRLAAEKGSARAQYFLGMLYRNGKGVQKDDLQAYGRLIHSARAGDAAAQFEVGKMHVEGRIVAKDSQEALTWFKRGAASGSVEAQLELAKILSLGIGAPRDDKTATHWLQQAARQGHAEAQFLLARMYQTGRAGVRDYVQAYMWYSLSADGGFSESRTQQRKLAMQMGGGQIAESERRKRDWLLDPGFGALTQKGSTPLRPEQETTHTLTATEPSGDVQQMARIAAKVQPPDASAVGKGVFRVFHDHAGRSVAGTLTSSFEGVSFQEIGSGADPRDDFQVACSEIQDTRWASYSQWLTLTLAKRRVNLIPEDAAQGDKIIKAIKTNCNRE